MQLRTGRTRRRRRTSMAPDRGEAFQEPERSSQEAPDSTACNPMQNHARRVACSGGNRHSHELSYVSDYEESSSLVSCEIAFLHKSKWSGDFANPARRMGFLRIRTVSLDDFGSRGFFLGSGMSRDDSCIPFVPDCSIAQIKNELLAAAPISISKRFQSRKRSGEEKQAGSRSQRCEYEREYDLVGSPGPKFLRRVSARSSAVSDEESAPSFKSIAAVPFKWEEAPGKPKPEVTIEKPDPGLPLPPGQLFRSSTMNKQNAGKLDTARRARSVNHKQGLHLVPVEPKQELHLVEKSSSPTSPTSVFCGPGASTSNSSSAASDSPVGSEMVLVSDAESRAVIPIQESKSSRGAALKKSIKRFMHRPEWLKKRLAKKHCSKQVEMWEPTLATYFHDSSDNASKSELTSVSSPDNNGQIVLLDQSDGSYGQPAKVVGLESSEGNSNLKVESDELWDDGMYCACPSPGLGPFSPSRFRSVQSGPRKPRKWMVKRIRRSSRLFQMFVFKAVKHTVQPRRKASQSKLLYNSSAFVSAPLL